MSNPLGNWLRSRKLKSALQRGEVRLAQKLLQEIQNSRAKLSWLEKLFRDKLQAESYQQQYKREVASLGGRLREASQRIEKLEQLNLSQPDNFILQPDTEFISYISKSFQLIEHDENKLQATGIDKQVFDELEINLAEYLEDEFRELSKKKQFLQDLDIASQDIAALKKGIDPEYQYSITPHIYFIRYFLEGVYSSYLAWFLVYQSGLLKPQVNLLDIGAGSGAMFYGLFAFFKSLDLFAPLVAQVHISYCSFEKQKFLQYYGLQFWRRFVKIQKTPAANSYLRFYTSDIFKYENSDSVLEELPVKFYDFIVISHCIFAEKQQRIASHQIYKEIFKKSLKDDGYVLVVVQGRRLCQAYEWQLTEDQNQEQKLIDMFVEELGLHLVWYKYITSTGKRTPMKTGEFAKFATENLPPQKHMSILAKNYRVVNYDLNYVLDDYVILAQK